MSTNIHTFQDARRQCKTVGDTISALTEAFSGYADINAMFILEMALKTVRENHELRMKEHEEFLNRNFDRLTDGSFKAKHRKVPVPKKDSSIRVGVHSVPYVKFIVVGDGGGLVRDRKIRKTYKGAKSCAAKMLDGIFGARHAIVSIIGVTESGNKITLERLYPQNHCK